ncbi:hypothetical protein LV716_11085 [Flagellimonas sp. HMM57]|uniref:hypothetical protein n=1 Tax=unclassified Flagellimonas TaxID=2644544 RepID=UPI0013CF79B8|nr:MULTISPECIES: hypothetical protein [unclassified Flagellimonas]UII74808.1 hypothetical protein LV716_11085 [Flagellimonas sp. HMM57]
MRFFKVKTINWKYIFGEIFLIFVGINLAIWFNDWNSSKAIQNDKEVALSKIKVELEANLEELVVNRSLNQKIPSFLTEMDSLKNGNEALILTPSDMKELWDRYPEQIKGVDSIPVDDKLNKYEIDAFVNLEITDLSSIAWDVAKSTGIFHKFGYDCLYELQGLYNTQDLVKTELKNATDALRTGTMQDFLRVLEFMVQLENQLEDQYREMIKSIDNCK